MTTKQNESLKFTKKVMDCMKDSPTSFHVIKKNIEILEKNGFTKLNESNAWNIQPGKSYYVTRNNSSLIAFKIPKTKKFKGFMIGASHSDHPCYKLINNAEETIDENYKLAIIEEYPKSIEYTWFDNPLSVGGKVTVKTKDGFDTKIVNVDRPLLMIPSLASHMQREFDNKEENFVFETRMKPLFSTDSKSNLLDIVLKENKINKKDVIDCELFVYRQSDPILWGANNEFMSSRAIDDQLSVFCSLYAILDSNPKESIPVHAVFDNEEIGSFTTQGASSSYLADILFEITCGLGISNDDYIRMMANSFGLSIDNAHALHPNFTDKYNKIAKTYIGKGAVIKKAASYAYCTNATSYSILYSLCNKNNIKIQEYYNRPGITPGTTLAKEVLPKSSIIGCDVGVAQLAMHSGFETCGTNDVLELKKMVEAVYSATITMKNDGNYTIK